ncbi:Uncharacterized protein PBTT_09051 [Plasmodiophora brassicae]|uniref:Uncharacterized protein n=2 Tax=Plasmodiophora brassicae TaxID=37360 RepID=A0A3P3YL65_PLABS|nr:unnamed protein product [Plasmodiophora brassicae]
MGHGPGAALPRRSTLVVLARPRHTAFRSTSSSPRHLRTETFFDGNVRSVTSYGFAFENTTFNISSTAVLALGGADAHLSSVGPHASNRIIVVEVNTVTVNVADWTRACRVNGCAGLVFHANPSSLLRTTLEIIAWSYWIPEVSPLASVPAVVVVDDLDGVSGNDVICMASDGPSVEANPASLALRRPSMIAAFTFTVIASGAIIVFIVFRILQFVVDDKWALRAPPRAAIVTLAAVFLGQAVRCVRAANIAWFHNQGLPFGALVLTSYLELPLISMVRVGIALIMTPSLAALGPDPSVLIADRIAVAAGTLIIVATFVVLGIAANTQVMPMGVVASYLFFGGALTIFSVNQGYACVAVTRQVLASQRQIGVGVSTALSGRRRVFATRLRISWLLGAMFIASHFVTLAVQDMSPTHFLAAHFVNQVCGLLAVSSLVATFRPEPSAMDNVLGKLRVGKVDSAMAVPSSEAKRTAIVAPAVATGKQGS